ncbi:hypothetical protein BKA70DRAFT_1569527 [Coprinopsis sp. MPI-PUGE-AT-0042]|nr:hypothetical protein BKA70DRAFT_1569527 [Coprinopsis sp. MPI-PUGE-AT-0042]
MASAFTIKFKKTQGGPPNEEVEFELVDTTSGVQRRVDWQSTWGVGSFVRLLRRSSYNATLTFFRYMERIPLRFLPAGARVFLVVLKPPRLPQDTMTQPSHRMRLHRRGHEPKSRLPFVPVCFFSVCFPSGTHPFPTLANE